MALGIHLFPYRTQKLSLITLMVLGGRPPGRVRNRQITRASQLTSSFLLTEYTNLARPAEWGPKTRFFQKLFRPTGLSFRHKYAKSRRIYVYRTQKLSLATPMVLGGWPPGRVGSCWIIGLSLLTKSFLVQKIYTCHEKSPSTKAYPRSRATFRGKWWCLNSWTQIKAYLPIPNTENKPIRLIEDPPRSGSPKVKASLRWWYSERDLPVE